MDSVARAIKPHVSPWTREVLTNYRYWPPVIDYRSTPESAIFLAGTGRSGTGWIANIINYANDFRYMYEPFDPAYSDVCRGFTFGLYLPAEADEPELARVAQAIVTGRIGFTKWSHQNNRRHLVGQRLVKEVRGHLWLRWLRSLFPTMRLVLLFRHPCAVVNSRMKRGNLVYAEPFLSQPKLMADHLTPFRADLENLKDASEIEQRVMVWCIQHYVPLRQFRRDQIHLAFYENFSEQPRDEIERLFAYTRQPFRELVMASVKRPSEVTRQDAAIMTGQSVVASWQREMAPADIERALRIVSRFGLDAIYGNDPMPNRDAAERMLAAASP
ncbi:MAG TPA: sulfotransferase [Candidatus Eremiobacteraceae bacterium]|nr:sulfotransferase [Candidatus Eremiobacteraceae bacterium]